MAGLKINFSQEEASSEARSFDPVPSGKYLVNIYDGEVRESQSEKNPGKEYWALEFVIDEGPYEGQHLWGNIMLWEGAAYSLAQLMKAIGRADVLQTGEIPELDDFVAKGVQIIVNVKKQRDKYKEEKEQDGEIYFKNEIKGYLPASADVVTGPVANTPKAKSGTAKKDPRLP